LLPSAEPGGTSWQKLGAVDVIVTVSITELHAPSLKYEIKPLHIPPLGAEHAHAEHVRPSSK
jgi:hypothetical protein